AFYVLGHDVERFVAPRYKAAHLEHGLSDHEPVALEDLGPYDERDVAELVLEGDEDRVGAGVLSSDDQPGDGDLGCIFQAGYVLTGRDLFGKTLSGSCPVRPGVKGLSEHRRADRAGRPPIAPIGGPTPWSRKPRRRPDSRSPRAGGRYASWRPRGCGTGLPAPGPGGWSPRWLHR
ncbi:MAG: hypothetical protein QGF24_10715, partial [Dehalococcoidia bacterium]|nr:hypothetical protein [Dehalococcoidia bacterium]